MDQEESLKEQIETEKAKLHKEMLEQRRERDHTKAVQVLRSLKLKKQTKEAKDSLHESRANWAAEFQYAYNAVHKARTLRFRDHHQVLKVLTDVHNVLATSSVLNLSTKVDSFQKTVETDYSEVYMLDSDFVPVVTERMLVPAKKNDPLPSIEKINILIRSFLLNIEEEDEASQSPDDSVNSGFSSREMASLPQNRLGLIEDNDNSQANDDDSMKDNWKAADEVIIKDNWEPSRDFSSEDNWEPSHQSFVSKESQEKSFNETYIEVKVKQRKKWLACLCPCFASLKYRE